MESELVIGLGSVTSETAFTRCVFCEKESKVISYQEWLGVINGKLDCGHNSKWVRLHITNEQPRWAQIIDEEKIRGL